MAKKAQPAPAGNTENAGAAPAAAPIRPPKKSEESLRVQYTDAELLEIGKKLAETAREKDAVEDEKKTITKSFGSRLDGLAAKISELSNNLSSGFTYRSIMVETTYGEPAAGMKTTRRLDTGASIRIEPMTLAEMQFDLPGFESLPPVSTAEGEDRSDRVKLPSSPEGVVVVKSDEDIFADIDTNNP